MAGADDDEPRRRDVLQNPRHRIDHDVRTLVAFETPYPHEQWCTDGLTGCVEIVVEPRRHDRDVLGDDASRHQVVARARRDRKHGSVSMLSPFFAVLGRMSMGARNEQFRQIRRERDRKRHVPERRRPEEMVHDRAARHIGDPRREERHLVQDVDDDVDPPLRDHTTNRKWNGGIVEIAVREALHGHAVNHGCGLRAGKRCSEELYVVPAFDEPPKDIEDVHLGAAREGILQIALVQNEDASARRVRTVRRHDCVRRRSRSRPAAVDHDGYVLRGRTGTSAGR